MWRLSGGLVVWWRLTHRVAQHASAPPPAKRDCGAVRDTLDLTSQPSCRVLSSMSTNSVVAREMRSRSSLFTVRTESLGHAAGLSIRFKPGS